MRGRLGAYGRWQLRDFFFSRGISLALLFALFSWSNIAALNTVSRDWAGTEQGAQLVRTLYSQLLSILCWTGALVGANGLVSNDRRRGFFRLLFSHPVPVTRYYLQAWVLHGAVLMAIGGVGAAFFGMMARPVSIPGTMAVVAVTWVMLGGLMLLLSTLTDWDGGVFLVLTSGGFLLSTLAAAHRAVESPLAPLTTGLQYALPPVHLIPDLIGILVFDGEGGAKVLAWSLGFGAICVALALLRLSRRPFVA